MNEDDYDYLVDCPRCKAHEVVYGSGPASGCVLCSKTHWPPGKVPAGLAAEYLLSDEMPVYGQATPALIRLRERWRAMDDTNARALSRSSRHSEGK